MYEKNNPIITSIFYILKEKKYTLLIFQKINSNCEKQIILLMISNKQKVDWHYLAVVFLSSSISSRKCENKFISKY